MKNMIRLEMSKALKNKFFLLANLIGCLVTILSLMFCLQIRGNELTFQKELSELSSIQINPMIPVNTLFNRWIGGEPFSLGSTIYFFIFPLLITIPYGWSYCDEKRSGYLRNVIIRSGKNSYYISKYIALFVSGGLTMVIPLAFNFLLTAMLFPAVTPNVLYSTSYGVFGESLMSELYYSQPFFYIVYYFCIDFLFCGLLACLCFPIAVFIKQRIAVVILPFFMILALHYSSTLFPALFTSQNKEISPLYFLRPVRSGFDASWFVILTEAAVLLILTVIVSIVWERRHEIY